MYSVAPRPGSTYNRNLTGYDLTGTNQILNGYSNAGHSGDIYGDQSSQLPTDPNLYLYEFSNGQPLPPANTVLLANDARCFYYEENSLITKFGAGERTKEQLTKTEGQEIGIYTGKYHFEGNRLKSVQVRTVLPFNRLGVDIETTYLFWVDTKQKYIVESEYLPGNTTGTKPPVINTNGGYETGDGSAAATQTESNFIAKYWPFIGLAAVAILRKKKKNSR